MISYVISHIFFFYLHYNVVPGSFLSKKKKQNKTISITAGAAKERLDVSRISYSEYLLHRSKTRNNT